MTSAHDPRPRPQYGEYADPEPAPAGNAGEVPSPPAVSPSTSESPSTAVNPTPSEQPATSPVAPQQLGGSGPLPGVPHNLGARSDGASGAGARSPQSSTTRPIDGAPQAPQGPAPYGPGYQADEAPRPAATHTPQGDPAAKPRQADRIVTIILIAIGSYFALSMALTLSQFTLEFTRVADELGVTGFTPPPVLHTIGTVGAILVLVIYAIMLIFSIRRMRARKLTFWAPLAAGVLAWVVFFVLFFVGLNASTELWDALLKIASDPDAAQQLLNRLNSAS